MPEPILQADRLVKHFSRTGDDSRSAPTFRAVDGVSFDVREGEILGVLGESGCGKSTVARLLMKLISADEGVIRYRGREILSMKEREFRPFRREMQMIFQNPFDSLDPSMKIRRLLDEPLRIWKIEPDKKRRENRICAMLEECGLPEESLDKYPGQFSGGQLQRVCIARALLLEPKFLIADEIVSALDVSIQAQILDLLFEMRRRHGLTVLFISHDIAVIRKISDRVMVMQSGRITEIGDSEKVFRESRDPFIRDLIEAVFTVSDRNYSEILEGSKTGSHISSGSPS